MTPPRRRRDDDRPNVVVLLTDQQRHDSTGLGGNPLDLTPNFDRLARQNAHAPLAFSPNPVCGPCRACLQTGTYATTNGVWRNGRHLPKHEELPNLGTLFKQAGYATGYVGKWHLAPDQAVKVEDRGGYAFWLAGNATEHDSDAYQTVLHDGDRNPVFLPGYRVDATVDAGIDFVNRSADHPFFLFVSLLEPHFQNPTDDHPAPAGYAERYHGRWTPPDLACLPTHPDADDAEEALVGGNAQRSLGGYWGMVKRIDEAYGRLHDALHSLGIADDTVLAFTSDHGCHFKTRNGEYKRSVHDVSVRVPLSLVGGPFAGGGEVPGLASLVDLPPTLLDACGIAVPGTMQGRPLLPVIRRQADAAEDVFAQVSEAHYGRLVRTRRWKYGVLAEDNEAAKQTGSTDAYRETHLYDLHSDPYELVNLIELESHSEVREVMCGRLLGHMKRVGEAEPTILPPARTRGGGQRRVTPAEARG